MKIYEIPKCCKPDCKNNAICLYAGVWICGPCLVIAHDKENKRKREMFLNG